MSKSILTGLGLVLACAAGGAAASSDDGASRLQPLSKEEFSAVMAEARRRYRREDPAGQPWEFLDREKLPRLLDMPEFAATFWTLKQPLIDQAGAWDYFRLESPSRAQAVWARILPEERINDPVREGQRSAESLHVYYADEKWGKEAGAQIAFLRCLPAAAWRVKHMEPLVWGMKNADWRAGAGLDFRQCVRKQREEVGGISETSPETARGLASAAIIEDRLSKFLLSNGCQGKGPDSCVHLLPALVELNPHHAQLPRVLQKLEPYFFPRVQDTSLDEREAAFLQLVYLTAKVPALLDHPKAWPAGELERLLAKTVALDLLMANYQGYNPFSPAGKRIASPWMALAAAQPLQPGQLAELQRLGRDSASTKGCQLSAEQMQELPAPLLLGYALGKLEREQTSCRALENVKGLSESYVQAATLQALAPLEGLLAFIATPGPARDEVRQALGAKCGDSPANDLWKVCRELAEEKAALLAAERKQREAQAAEETSRLARENQDLVDRQVCSEEMIELAGDFLRKSRKRQLTEGVASACKAWPGKEPYTLGVFIYEGQKEEQKQMLVTLIDQEQGKVIASYWTLVEVDAVTRYVDGIKFDTARYFVRPGLRAFGIDVGTYSPRSAEGGYGPMRTLYVREGAAIRLILSDMAVSSWRYLPGRAPWENGNSEDPDHEPKTETFSYTIGIAGTRSNGYADLLITRSSDQPKVKATTQLLRYDGKHYPAPQQMD
ncbi:hypothetical protein [Pseudoduganella sp. R-43]|uniref:hypothetical protein n=1 Tax=Pseudoduganella sp. R-43 TaxID=3404063 RepID=UPI003CF2AF16